MTTTDCFFVRCWVCAHEIEVEWGPETHSIARSLLIEHICGHSYNELLNVVLRHHVPREL